MNFTNCQVTIHAVNNYATVTVSDPSTNTTFDISASNAYSPYYTYQTPYGYYNGSNVCCHPVTNSNILRSTDISGAHISYGPIGITNTVSNFGFSGTTGTTHMYSYYN